MTLSLGGSTQPKDTCTQTQEQYRDIRASLESRFVKIISDTGITADHHDHLMSTILHCGRCPLSAE